MNNPGDVTREILWNVPTWATVLMYLLFVVAAGVFVRAVAQRVRAWKRGAATKSARPSASKALGRLFTLAIRQVIIWRSHQAGLSHFGIFWGFIVLFIGTVIVAIEEYVTWIFGLEQFIFYGSFYLIVSFALEVFGAFFIAGLSLAILRRFSDPRYRPLARREDYQVISLFLILGLSGFVVEGLRIAGTGVEEHDFEKWSFIGWGLAQAFGVLDRPVIVDLHLIVWLFHMVASMGFIAILPYTKLAHMLYAPLHIAATEPRPSGVYETITAEEVEESGKYGVNAREDFTRGQLLSFDACTQCGRCQNVCPAHATRKPLSPMQVVLDIAAVADAGASLHGDTISADVLWACTSCGACVQECPVAIDQLGAIVDMRRHLVGEGEIRGSEQKAIRSLSAAGNPWGLPADERLDWAKDIEVPTLDEVPDADILFWVGCAGSFDRRNQKVSQALVRILRAAGLSFAVLGKKERCTGDPARRMGDEFTYQELAMENVETLNAGKFKRIVTACPHCFNTIKNEYPALGGEYEVIHHSQLIAELVASGRLPLDATGGESVAFHDSCYLGRHNGEYDAPREALEAAGAKLSEPAQAREQGFCCGAGGGRMWMEEDLGSRINEERWQQLRVLQTDVVAVSCPFCMTMMRDAAMAESSETEVKDIAEVVASRLGDAPSAPPDDN